MYVSIDVTAHLDMYHFIIIDRYKIHTKLSSKQKSQNYY